MREWISSYLSLSLAIFYTDPKPQRPRGVEISLTVDSDDSDDIPMEDSGETQQNEDSFRTYLHRQTASGTSQHTTDHKMEES